MSHGFTLTLFATALLAAAPPHAAGAARAASPPCTVRTTSTRPGASCPALFGDERVWATNGASRRAALESVYEGTNTIWLTERGDWTNPTRASLRGIDLVETGVAPGCEPVAVLRVDARVAPGCEPGPYVVRVDDSLGSEGRVLGITAGVLLLEIDGVLRYTTADGGADPVWRMVWHPDWKFEERPVAGGMTPAASPYLRPPFVRRGR